MQKIYVEFDYQVNGKQYIFKAEPNAPLVDAREAILLLLKELGQIEDNIKAQQASLEAEKPKDEAVEAVVVEEQPKSE